MRHLYITIGIFTLFFQSCKPTDIPIPEGETPLFRAEFNLEQTSVYIEAGRDYFFQFADAYLDTNDIYVFRSLLAKDEFCTSNCQESIQIEIRSNSQSNGQLPDLTQALPVGNYNFAQATDTSYTIYRYQFNGSVVGSNQAFQKTVHWQFSPEIDTNGLNLTTEEIVFELIDNIPFRVKLDVIDSYGAKGSKEIQVLSDSHSGLSLSMIGNATNPILQASSDPVGNIITGLTWMPVGSGSTYTILPSHPYTNYCVRGKDATGNEVTTCGEYIYLFGQNIFCTAQINMTKEEEIILDNQWLADVNIVYTDEQGQKWSTFDANQTNSYFLITQIENYRITNSGFKSRKITATFNALVTNGIQTKPISGTTVFAIGIPQ